MRPRSHALYIVFPALLLLGLCLGACDERVSLPEEHLITADSLRATVGDTLLIWAIYTGDPSDVARFAWDFQSDGILDFEFSNLGEDYEGVGIEYIYNRADDYVATLQVTTVRNRLLRATTPVTITDENPVISAEVPDSVACGETFELVGWASDDAGRRVYWDLGGEGAADFSADFSDSVTLLAEGSYDEPGIYTMVFGASDNDGNLERLEFEMVVGTPPVWSSGAAMSAARADLAAAVVDDRIYVFGGRHGRGVVGSVEIYDPGADSWSFGAALPTPRWGAEAVVKGQDIYVIGGVTQADTVFPMVEIYHTDSDSWTTFDPGQAKNVMPILKRGFAAIAVGETSAAGDSIMLVGGMAAGAVIDTTVIYSTVNDSFSVDRTPTHFPAEGRAWLDAVTAWNDEGQTDGKLFTVGGTADGALPSARVESYQPLSDFWRNEDAMPTARIAPAATYHAGQLYVMGGGMGSSGASDLVEVFSLQREIWEILPAIPEARSGAVALVVADRIYLVGGATSTTSPYHVEGSRTLQILDPWRCGP
jgi:hypothetical protein